MFIEFVRIDDKLIHAQIILGWVPIYKPYQIVVANNEVACDELRKKVLLAAASELSPNKLTIAILSLDETVSLLKSKDQDQEKIILVLSNPVDVVYLIKNAVPIKSISLGWMSYRSERKQIFKTVYAGEEDIKAFRELKSMGVDVKYQASPFDCISDVEC